MSKQKTEQAFIPIEWESDENHTFVMVNHMAVNFDAQSSFLRFYQISPPAIIDGANPPDSVQAKLVGGIVVPADQIPLFIAALESGFEKYTEARGAQIQFESRLQGQGDEE